MAACERSLTRLRTDRLDCYLLHWPGHHPLEDTFAAFEQLQRSGKIRVLGREQLRRATTSKRCWRSPARARIACNQVLYHLQERAIEHAVLPWCEAHGVAVVAYSPFGHGSFPGPRTAGGRVLQEIADAHGATPRQVALRFLVRRPALFAIPKAADPEHAAENAGGRRAAAHGRPSSPGSTRPSRAARAAAACRCSSVLERKFASKRGDAAARSYPKTHPPENKPLLSLQSAGQQHDDEDDENQPAETASDSRAAQVEPAASE